VLLMLATPFLVQAGPKAGEWLQGSLLDRLAGGAAEHAGDGEAALEDHVVIAGYGPAGRHLAGILEQREIPFVVVEMNPQATHELEEKGLHPVIYGDASRPHILEAAGVARAKLCAVVINDARAARRITRLARHENPTLQLVVRTRFLADVEPLHEAGADVVVPEELEATVRVFANVLRAYLIPQDEIERYEHALRADDYQLLRGGRLDEAHQMVLKGLTEEGLHIRVVAVRPGAPVEGKTLEALALRRRHEITVLTVRRDHRTISAPAGDFQFDTDDRLVLLGTAERFEQCADLFREAAAEQPETEGAETPQKA
jgi:CPA2 family monovalent cation:H+ antiporter-2